MQPKDTPERQNFIQGIKTPLGFWSLIVLVIESGLGGLALTISGANRAVLVIYIIPGSLLFLAILVAAIAVLRPEAIWGKRYSALEESFAKELGEDLYSALEGALDNLGETDRDEAYETLREVIANPQQARSRTTKQFRHLLAETIISRANTKVKMQKLHSPLGVVRP